MNPVPVVINASFCRNRDGPNEVLESPMARIANDHVSFQFFLQNHKRCSQNLFIEIQRNLFIVYQNQIGKTAEFENDGTDPLLNVLLQAI